MPETTYIRAITGALAEAMRADERVFVLGEDVAEGGPYTATDGLAERSCGRRKLSRSQSENQNAHNGSHCESKIKMRSHHACACFNNQAIGGCENDHVRKRNQER